MSALALDHLLAAIRSAPALPGARCRGRSHLFDPQHPQERPEATDARHVQALGLCSLCPSLVPCREWVDGLPQRRRPLGVVAGRVRESRVNP